MRRVVQPLAEDLDFEFTIQVLPITVAALMTPDWISSRIDVPESSTELMVPGYVGDDVALIESVCHCPVVVGPHDLRSLPDFWGRPARPTSYGQHDIEIIAEINHAPRLPINEIVRQAKLLVEDGADVVDIGCDPGKTWEEVGKAVAAVRSEGIRVSIDSFNGAEVEAAIAAGAELVLSVNASNREAAIHWNVEVVAIPDEPTDVASLEQTIEFLSKAGVPFRIDPILEPIGCGFAASLSRYAQVRVNYPDREVMMGIGNLTELTDVDSAGVNLTLLAICQELEIRSVLTTQVINWARSSVRECDFARRLVHYAVSNQTIPKHVDMNLVMLRDGKLFPQTDSELDELARNIKDHNYRLFATHDQLHILGSGQRWSHADAFVLFDMLLNSNPKNVDSSHAFYLGFELAKATTAMTLGKQYRQDEALKWGFLTRPEDSHLQRRKDSKTKND